MKLLVLQDWNPRYGGAERYTQALCSALQDAGDEVRLLTANVSNEARAVADHLAPASDRLLAKGLLQIHNPFAAAAVRRAVRTFRPNAALVNMFALYLSPAAVDALGEVPYALLVSDYKCICPVGHRLLPDLSVCRNRAGIACLRQGCTPPLHWLRDQWRYRRIRAVVENAAVVFSTSDALRDMLAEQGIQSRRLYLFSNLPDDVPQRNPDTAPRLLYLGRLDVEKGVDLLLRAFSICLRSVPTCRLHIVGRGERREALERLADSLDLQGSVRFLGWREGERIDRELSESWALVAPSLWPEPFGLVALEAIFRGVPAIVPDAGGFAQTVEHGVTGLHFRTGDVSDLANALIAVSTGAAFPRGCLDPTAVDRALDRFGPQRHVSTLRSVLHEIARFDRQR